MAKALRRAVKRVLRAEDGFTIVEGVVAGIVVVVGLLGVLTMLTGSLRGTSANNARVAGTNLSRELVEAVRSIDYDDMSGADLPARLQARGLGSGDPWTIERRGVTYTISASACTYDDPSDKLATPAPAGVCTPQATGAAGDPNGEDFRRATFELAWNEPGKGQRSLKQTTLVVNPTGGLGPRITAFTPVTQTITSSATTATVVWSTTAAQSLQWSVDDGKSSGSLTGTTSFTTNWDIGSSGSTTETLDGSYQMTAQPFDARGIAGEAKRANIQLNRRQPYPPPSLLGGHNTRLGDWVELQWSPNDERDVLGYRVMWAGPDMTYGNGNDQQVCPLVGFYLPPTPTRGVDLLPPSGAAVYYIVAIDRARDNSLREGDRRLLAIGPPSARPAPPSDLTVTTVAGNPKLSWTEPASGTVSFYRIYRDGLRYDRTSGPTTTFTDASAGSIGHFYWVTSVDPTFNESNPIGPVLWLS